MISNIIGWILFGFIVGLLGRLLVPGRQPLGFIMTTVLGVIGSFAGGAVSKVFLGGEWGQTSGWIFSVIGAAVVLAIYIAYARKTHHIG